MESADNPRVTMPPPRPGMPPLDEIGRDLLEVAAWRRAVSLAMPFALAAAFFVFAHHGC